MLDIRSVQQLFHVGNSAGSALRAGRPSGVISALVSATVGVALAGHLVSGGGRRRRIYRRFLRGLARRRTPMPDSFRLNPL